MSELASVPSVGAAVPIDEAAVLRTLKLDPRDPQTQALLLVCRRYNLDPVLRHIILVDGRPYVSRDGLLHTAHLSGQLDGIEVVDQDETDTHWVATVSVFRKDMARPFKYVGRYPKKGLNAKYGVEMATKCAEVAALRRAFDVALSTVEEQWTDRSDPVDPVWLSAAEVAELRDEVEQHPDAGDIWKWVKGELGVQGGRVTEGQAVQIRDRLGRVDGVVDVGPGEATTDAAEEGDVAVAAVEVPSAAATADPDGLWSGDPDGGA